MPREHRGRRVVLLGYAIVVTVAAGLGYAVGLAQPEGVHAVDVLGVVTIPPTPLGLAFWGVLSVGGLLGVGLGLVMVASGYANSRSH